MTNYIERERLIDSDRIFKFLQKCNRNHNVSDVHSLMSALNAYQGDDIG